MQPPVKFPLSDLCHFCGRPSLGTIRQSVAYPKANVKIVPTHGGVTVGEDGGSHQSVEDIAIMRAIPNMTVIVPADAADTRGAVAAAAAHKGPVYIRLAIKFPGYLPMIISSSWAKDANSLRVAT